MFKPSLEEFKKLAKSGNLIPVYKEILADLDTPVSAYMKIGDGDYSFLLESVEGGEKWARYCFLGCDPAVVVSSKGRNITIDENGKQQERKIDSGTPLSAIKEILARYNPVDVPGLPRFSGERWDSSVMTWCVFSKTCLKIPWMISMCLIRNS